MPMRVKGEDHPRHKITMWDVIAIRELLNEKPSLNAVPPASMTKISKAFGIGRTTVRYIRDRRHWKWLP